jgi:hypothetical protein
MFHLDNNSGISAMPKPAAQQSSATRWFTEGGGNNSPSWPGQDWFNIVQAELLNVLTTAGIAPEKTAFNQLALAIKAIINKDALLKNNLLSEIRTAGASSQKTARENLDITDATLNKKGLTQLSNAVDSTSEAQSATSKAVKIAMDNANARLAKDRNGADIPNVALFLQNVGLVETVNLAAGALQKDQNLNDVQDKAKARAALQLGSAATATLITSTTDDASGRVLTVGYQGIGGNAGPLTKGDFNQLSPSGFINGQTNGPNDPTLYMGFNVRHADAYQFTLVGRQQRYFAQCCEAGAFKGWDEFYTTAHKPTSEDVGALPITGGKLRGTLRFLFKDARPNSNCMIANDDASGILSCAYGYYQDRFDIHFYDEKGAWASNPFTVGRNGNVTVAGNLGGGAVFDAGKRVYSPNNPPPATDLSAFATQQWVLQNFVQNMRLGSAISTTWWANGDDCPAGHVLTGGDFNSDKSYVRYKPVQVLINGQWVTISG